MHYRTTKLPKSEHLSIPKKFQQRMRVVIIIYVVFICNLFSHSLFASGGNDMVFTFWAQNSNNPTKSMELHAAIATLTN